MKILSLHGPKFDTKRMALAAMLIALQIILEKLSIGDPAVLKIGLGFIATALIGFLLGPWIGALSMIINDLISNTLLSSGTMFFPGFTLSAAISGIIAGMFLYQQQINWRRILIYEFCQILITNVFFTTLWLYLMGIGQGSSAMSFMALLMVRLPKEVISWPIEALIVLTLLKAVERAGLKTTFD
ncbi:folate family ECF transporter S component [Limosilactobacillus mucosae]|uniref:folate family ECF transporter S component n=1 Tax=Limosilactobacillus mucosae TaxID=97478 RepID=UPI0022E7B54C|nr:folate family ECF transporter S component [Limosilactobacillus mucosae]